MSRQSKLRLKLGQDMDKMGSETPMISPGFPWWPHDLAAPWWPGAWREAQCDAETGDHHATVPE